MPGSLATGDGIVTASRSGTKWFYWIVAPGSGYRLGDGHLFGESVFDYSVVSDDCEEGGLPSISISVDPRLDLAGGSLLLPLLEHAASELLPGCISKNRWARRTEIYIVGSQGETLSEQQPPYWMVKLALERAITESLLLTELQK